MIGPLLGKGARLLDGKGDVIGEDNPSPWPSNTLAITLCSVGEQRITVERRRVTFQSFEQAPSCRPRGHLDTASSELFVA
jgi:hypothetical protein